MALARTLVARGARGVAVEQLWRLGGRLYLRDVPTVVELTDLSEARLSAVMVQHRDIEYVALLRTSVADGITNALGREGLAARSEDAEYVVYSRNVVARQP